MKLFLAKEHTQELDERIQHLLTTKYSGQSLLVVLIGDNPSSLKYIGIKEKLCAQFGIDFQLLHLSSDLPDSEIVDLVAKAFADDRVGGGIIQLPLPRPELYSLLQAIPADKDIDVLSDTSRSSNRPSPLVKSIEYFLSKTKSLSRINDMSLGVIGDGFIVGVPVYNYFKSRVKKAELLTNYKVGDKLQYDLIICGTGHPQLVSGNDCQPGSSVIDFGSYVKEGKIVGDVDMEISLQHLDWLAPSPGGMGPLVTRFLLITFLENLK